MEFIRERISSEPDDEITQDFTIADFASGEHDRVPSFFTKIIPKFLESKTQKKRTTVYSIDMHALRLDSLLGILEESTLLDRTRVVQSKLESMDSEASFRPDMIEYLNNKHTEMIWLDRTILHQNRIPEESFDIGVLNNDVVGYLHEYYREYGDAAAALSQVHKTVKPDGLLIVTNPCSLYVIDNVAVLESIGFRLVEGFAIDLTNGTIDILDRNTPPELMSTMNHYSFLVFSKS